MNQCFIDVLHEFAISDTCHPLDAIQNLLALAPRVIIDHLHTVRMFHFLPRIPPTVIVNSFGLAESLRNIHLFVKFLTFDHHFGRYGEGKSAGQLGITFVALTAHDRVEIAGSASIRRDHSLMANGGLS